MTSARVTLSAMCAMLLQRKGYTNLSGLELQHYALEVARSRTRNISLAPGSALSIPLSWELIDAQVDSQVDSQ